VQPKASRLRFISAKTADAVSSAVSQLPFKVELKSVQWDGKRWYAWFILPEDERIDLRNTTL
jgi:hypothetical protein